MIFVEWPRDSPPRESGRVVGYVCDAHNVVNAILITRQDSILHVPLSELRVVGDTKWLSRYTP